MDAIHSQQTHSCLSLADGYLGECPLVRQHNVAIGAQADEVIEVPQELTNEFAKLSTSLMKLSRAFELGLIEP
jgi:hypothetical protein